jgi:hypothetical protein
MAAAAAPHLLSVCRDVRTPQPTAAVPALHRGATTLSHSGLGAGCLVLIPGWAGHAGGLQALRRRLSEVERAEQLRLRLRAGEEAAAVAAAAAAKADAGEEETAASLHGSGGMGCSLSVLLAHTELCPGPPGMMGQSSTGPHQKAWVRDWAAGWMNWVPALTAVCDDGGGDTAAPRRGHTASSAGIQLFGRRGGGGGARAEAGAAESR